MNDIPEGLVEAVARAIMKWEGTSPELEANPMTSLNGDVGTEHYWGVAIAAIQAHNAWLSDQDNRIKAFVEFRGPNPRD